MSRTLVLLEGAQLGSAPSMAQLRSEGKAKRQALRDLYRDFLTMGRPTAESLAKLRRSHPAVASAWGTFTPGTLQGLAVPGTGALAQITSAVPDGDKAVAYYARLDESAAAENLPRERAWAAMMDRFLPLVRSYVKPNATREEAEELVLRIGLAADASGQSITPDRKLAEYPGARHASWMGGQIGYGGIGSWENLQAQSKQYLDLGFQWAEIFGRWADPPNARTLGNDTGAYPYLPTWAQPLAAQAWKNRRMISTELASYDGHAAHVEQRSRGWAAQMEPVQQDESAVGSPQVANAVIAAGTAAQTVQLAVADPTYMAPWEKVATQKGKSGSVTWDVFDRNRYPGPGWKWGIPPSGIQQVNAREQWYQPTPEGIYLPVMAPPAAPVPFADRPPPGASMQLQTDIPVMASPLDFNPGVGIPYVKAVVDHAPPPSMEAAPVPIAAVPPSGTPAKVDPKTGLPPSTSAGTVPVPGMSPVPMGAQSMLPSISPQAMLALQQGQGLIPAGAGGSWFDQESIPGVKNLYLVIGGGALLLLLMLRSKRD